MDKLLDNEFWSKLPSKFQLVDEKDYGRFSQLPQEATPERIYLYEGEYIVFNAIEDWQEFLEVYEQNLINVEKRLKTVSGDWRNASVMKPVFYGWKNIKGKRFYFSIFESYNSTDRLSTQIFCEYKDMLISVSFAIKKQKDLSFESLFNDNKFLKGIIKVFL